jgi:hypothetical protein
MLLLQIFNVSTCLMCYRSPIVSLAALPQQWLDNILLELTNEETSAKLCATRRSAGVPFLIQVSLVGSRDKLWRLALTGIACIDH